MPLVPYSAKNTPERYPYATLLLIAVNCLVYLLTANFVWGGDTGDGFADVRSTVIQAFARSWVALLQEPWRLLTTIFLHQDPFHLLGNMLFLWIFGPAVEGRLGYLRYIALYLVTGIFAGFFQAMVISTLNPERFGLGASGAIMGLMGAYLWLFPFATICMVIPHPVTIARVVSYPVFKKHPVYYEWQAQWVVLYYFLWNLLSAIFYSAYSSVGNFAHMSGLLSGMGIVALMKVKRDGRRASTTRKMRAEGINLEALSVQELNDLLRHEPENERLILAYGMRVSDPDLPEQEALFLDALRRYGPTLSEKAVPETIASAVLAISTRRGKLKLPVAPLLRIGARLEKRGSLEDLRLAGQLFQALFQQEESGIDAETALIRYAQIKERIGAENFSEDHNESIRLYRLLIERFPRSPHLLTAHTALERLGAIDLSS